MLRNARRTAIGLVLTAVLAITGCSALGSNSASENAANGPLEKLNLVILNSADLGPTWLAQDEGYFKAEGLDVTISVAENGSVSQAKAIKGEADIALTTDPLFFVAQASGTVDLQLVADGTSASPKSNAILTIPTSPVKNIQDLKGHRIAYTSKNATSDILTQSVLIDHGIDPKTVTFVPVGLPNMAEALRRGDVDAIYQPEPFIHLAAQSIGAIPIIDVASGATLDFPITVFVSTKKWVQANPKRLAAFQRALAKGVKATADRKKVEAVIVKYTKVDPDVAALMTLPNYKFPKADARRIQRVPDLLLKLGAIKNNIDASSIMAPQVGG